MLLWLTTIAASLCSSCGYHFGAGGVAERYETICVPYAEGDLDGSLTAALIEKLATQGALRPSTAGQLLLTVCLFPPEETNVGFTYASDNDKVLASNEARLTLRARVELSDRCTGACLLGPLTIPSSLSFDFESDLSNIDRHDFALGQLQMYNLARDGALTPLTAQLAEKIVDYVVHGW